MNENLNLLEILKDCPEGTKLYSTVHGEVEFVKCQPAPCIIVKLIDGSYENYGSQGLLDGFYGGECVLFPSKDQRDWSKFKPKKPKFDPKTLQPFDKVLSRNPYSKIWSPNLFGHFGIDGFYCVSGYRDRVVPYNEDTEYLIGTNEEAPEYCRYWEEYIC